MKENKCFEELKLKIGIWEKTLDVQMHFNDLCLRIRNFAVSVLGVLLGVSAIAYRFGDSFSLPYFGKTSVAVLFLLISLIAWMAFYLMDRYWYHELLKGAVHHSLKIEQNLSNKIQEIGLSTEIKEQSHESLGVNAA